MSQPHPSQHPSVSDMQFWQQKLMYKQLQDLQKQQQLQQLDNGARHQLSACTKAFTLNQSAMMNGMPNHNVPNYTWSNNLTGALPAVPDNSHMFVSGNMNWANATSSSMHNTTNGIIVSNDQSPSTRSMGYFPDQSFHGIPMSSSRGSTNYYSQLSEMSNDCNNFMTKEAGNQLEKNSGQFNSFRNNEHFIPQSCLEDTNLGTAQNFEAKGFFGHASMEMLNTAKTNDVQGGQNQFHVRQEQPDWSGSMQEKPAEQVGTSKYVASLDPTEQKILFGTDDDNWGASLSGSITSGAGGFLQGLPLANDYLGGFPSIQSGSWSALMQEAVQSSISDKESQEEWSGLDFQNMEQSIFKPSVISSDSGKRLAAWNDSNLQSASLTTKPLTLFNDTEAGPSLSNAPTFQPSFERIPAERNSTQADASHLTFQLSPRHTNDKQCHQVRKQNQLQEVGQVQVPENDERWVGQTYQQQENNSSDMQHIQSVWTQQQDSHMSDIARPASRRPSDWNSNYHGRVGNSNFSGDGNMQSFHSSHANMNSGVQSVGNNLSQVHSEGSFLANYGSIPTLNNENNQQTSSQKTVFGKSFALASCINSEGDQNVKKGHNQQSGRYQNWEFPTESGNERLNDNYDYNKVHPKVVSGEGYVSSRSFGNQSNIINGEKQIFSLSGHDQNSNLHECQKPSNHSDKQTVGYNMFQNQISNLGMNVESSYPRRNLSYFQGASNSIIQGSKNEGKVFTGKSRFNGPIFPDDTMDITKRTVTRTDEAQPRDAAILVHDSTSFDRSAINYSQSKNSAQTSQNMLELLHKVDHSGNCGSVPEPDKSTESVVNTSSSLFTQSSGMQGFGLQLAPPSQRQQRSHFALSSQMSINDVKNSKRLNQEAEDNDQMVSTYAPPRQSLPLNEASERDNLSNISGEKHKEASESGEQLRSLLATVSDLPYPTNEQQQENCSGKTFLLHQQHQRKTISSSTGHEVSHQSVEFPLGNQTNVPATRHEVSSQSAVRSSSTQWRPQDSRDGVVTGQSVSASLPTPVRGVLPSRLVPMADTHVPANSNSPSLETDNMKKMVVGFPQVQNSGPFTEGRLGLQPSTAGMTPQAGFSRMLQNVWSNISAQQHLAGLHPAKLTPQLLQSIINNNRDTSSWGLQKGDDQGSKGENTPEVGTGYSTMGHADEHLIKGNFLKPPRADVDSAPKTVTSPQGEEVAERTPSGGPSNVSVSSLVRLHQQDMDRGKGGHDSAAHFQAVNTSTSAMSVGNSDIGFSGSTSMSVDARQQNYSLLHQMQAMKGSDSGPSKLLGKSLKGTDYTSNAPQMHWNATQKSAYVQNPSFHVREDGKVNESSQGALSSDAKMFSFGSKHIANNLSTSATVENHVLQNSMQAHSTTPASNLLLGTEQTQINSQMAPSWFQKYGNYKNGAVIAGSFNGQLSVNASAQQYRIPKIPRMGYNPVVDQRSDGNEIVPHEKNTAPTNVVTSEISSYVLLPTLLDHGIAQRSKKRKRSTLKLPWHKLVTEGSHRLLSISTGELDWAQASNRFIEKVGDTSETIEDISSVVQSRRRLILTTQLAQQLLPAVPARILGEEATSSYESMTFCIAKDVLADACGMLSLAARDSGANLENQSWTTKKLKPSVVEDFIERSKKLESDFLRSEKTSLLDVQFECQELERFSIVNRLGKFHARTHTDVVEGSSNLEAASRRTFLQRYVTALPPPESLPERIACFSI